ncbi:hypothetical protein [Rhodococcus koreensis]|uniref:hypothetical protein n=1 Tax=Rhodococcus koreensis TaxID=99653 RepID=UPI00366DF97B
MPDYVTVGPFVQTLNAQQSAVAQSCEWFVSATDAFLDNARRSGLLAAELRDNDVHLAALSISRAREATAAVPSTVDPLRKVTTFHGVQPSIHECGSVQCQNERRTSSLGDHQFVGVRSLGVGHAGVVGRGISSVRFTLQFPAAISRVRPSA